jgi:hypothetical protein
MTPEADGERWKITYDDPKTKMGKPSAVARGSVLFEGSVRSSGTRSATVYTHHGRCPLLRYSWRK